MKRIGLILSFLVGVSLLNIWFAQAYRRLWSPIPANSVFRSHPKSNFVKTRPWDTKIAATVANDIKPSSIQPPPMKKGLSKTFTEGSDSLQFFQRTTGLVPRSYLPAILYISSFKNEENLLNIMDTVLQWYLDSGGRIARLTIAGPASLSPILSRLGSASIKDINDDMIPSDYSVYKADRDMIIDHCKAKLAASSEPIQLHRLHDILGRLQQDLGDVDASIDSYTKSLQANPSSSATFRNLGSSYQSKGNHQMAFASFQQSLQLDPNDHLVYLKLAMMYEEYASKDWTEAAENAVSCYQFYLNNVDEEDTAILTRLGNLLVREHRSEEAIKVYEKALTIDPSLFNVWFNKAHAELKLEDFSAAALSLKKTLELQPNIIAAKHMLTALTESEALSVLKTDEEYVKHLYDGYAQTYDEHGKKLLYSAPRVIRQEMGNIYKAKKAGENLKIASEESVDAISPPIKKATMTAIGTCSDHPMEAPPLAACVDGEHVTHDPNDCQGEKSFMSEQLDILDLGCGTGLSGSWLKDYARSLTGVDISENMVQLAKKKGLYDELHVDSLAPFLDRLNQKDQRYDLVVAADVLSYIGDLSDIIPKMARTVRVGGHMVFTAETSNDDIPSRGYKLLRNGRFGYTRDYLDKLLTQIDSAQFQTIISRSFSPRLDIGKPVPGFLYILERTA